MRNSLLLVAVVVSLLAALAACGKPTPWPTPVASIITPLPPTPDVPPFYTSSSDRLVLPTLTPGPSATAQPVGGSSSSLPTSTPLPGRPTPALPFAPVSPESTPMSLPTVGPEVFRWDQLTLTEDEIDAALALVPASCIDHFRGLLVSYDGPAVFGPEAAYAMSAKLVEQRPDCAEKGWSPEFPIVQVCNRVEVTGKTGSLVPPIFRVQLRGERALAPSMRDPVHGHILLHFTKMPFDDRVGCWFFRPDNQRWYWNIRGPRPGYDTNDVFNYMNVDSGVDYPKYPQCDALLRALLPKVIARGQDLDAVNVASAIDTVRLLAPRHCAAGSAYGGYLWNLYPQRDPQSGCQTAAPTGKGEDGSYVINWVGGHFDAMGQPCWVLVPVEAGDSAAPASTPSASEPGPEPSAIAPTFEGGGGSP